MSNFDSTYSAIASITDGKYDSTYSALKAAAVSMGAEDKDYDSEYSVAVALAEVAGNGGGSSSNSGITMKELLEEAKRPNNEKKYASYRYDVNGYIPIYYLYEVGSLVPYIEDSNYGGYRPLREMNYNYDNSQFEYVKNEDGEDAYFASNWNFRTNYQPKIDNNEYWWRIDIWNNPLTPQEIGLKTGGLIPNNFVVYDYNSNNLSGFNFGFKTKDEYGNESFKYPSQYFIYGGYIGENRDWWDKTDLRRMDGTSSESVPYMDKIDYNDESSNPIYGYFGVNRSTIGYGDYLSYNMGYFSKYVYTGSDPVSWVSSSQIDMTTIDELDSLNELKFHSTNGSGSFVDCVLNAPINLKFFWDLSNVASNKSTKLIGFGLCDKLKSVEIDFDNTYTSQYIYVDFVGLKNVEYIKFNSTKGGGYKIRGTGGEESLNLMFDECSSLTSIPDLDTSNIKVMSYMFNKCSSLTSIPLLDCGKVTSADGMLRDCKSLTDLGGFKDLKVSITYGFLETSPNLTTESLMNVINNLYDLTANGLSGQTLKFGTTNLNKLTSDQIAVATNKGWTLT